jgi:hypothetical protein
MKSNNGRSDKQGTYAAVLSEYWTASSDALRRAIFCVLYSCAGTGLAWPYLTSTKSHHIYNSLFVAEC